MNDPLIARFAEACGAAGPLNLRVDLAEGGVLAEGSVAMPFALVGRADACDVTLADPDVNPRHAWLQVVGGRVWAVDLGSRAGLVWPSGRIGSGWLDVGTPLRVGPFRVHLAEPVSRKPHKAVVGSNPLLPATELARTHPTVALEFRNGKRATDRWQVNRVVTLVGRAPECKIHLNADDISGYHCGLVNTPTGLWVVDLSGHGVVVSGERMRVAPLPHGSELWVGRFLIGCRIDAPPATPPSGSRPGLPAPPVPLPRSLRNIPESALDELLSGKTPCLEDEVPLGETPPRDPDAGMPSSHILTDAANAPTDQFLAGPVSNPIMVSSMASASPLPDMPLPPVSPPPAPEPPDASSELVLTTVPGIRGLVPAMPELTPGQAEALVAPLLRQLGEIHGQMFDQFQQSMLSMLSMFGQMHREQMGAMQQELARIQELNTELGKLQEQVARLADQPASAADTPPPNRRLTAGEARPPVAVPTGELPAPETAAAIQDWVLERINTLQQERQSRWQKLVGFFSGGTN